MNEYDYTGDKTKNYFTAYLRNVSDGRDGII